MTVVDVFCVANLGNRKGSEFEYKPVLENEWVLLKIIFMFGWSEILKWLEPIT
jgi:hypothetical protein